MEIEVTKKLIKDSLNELSQEVREKFLVKYIILQNSYFNQNIQRIYKRICIKVQEKSKSLDNVFVKIILINLSVHSFFTFIFL